MCYWFNRLFFFNFIYSSFSKKWLKCKNCGFFLFSKKVAINFNVCYKCGFHFALSSRRRMKDFFKNSIFFELSNNFLPVDFLNFFDTKRYYTRIAESQFKTGELEALLIFKGKIGLIDTVVCVFEFNFIGGSMGRVVGEKFLYAAKFSIKYRLPMICFSSSGGARMQESLFSLMQMSKVSYIIKKLGNYKLPYLSIIINPCMGGVSASVAMLGDIVISEPGALIGFTGLKIVKKMIKQKIPFNFQRSEFLLENGFLDFIVCRKDLYKKISIVLEILMKI